MEEWNERWKAFQKLTESVAAHPEEGLVAATTMKQGKRHGVKLTWAEELGQCLTISRVVLRTIYSN
jgi:hypothetical protein